MLEKRFIIFLLFYNISIGIESDQGYQNYLYHNGYFDTKNDKATLYYQGIGAVNTIGAMNGHRIPKEKKGPLGTFWKLRDEEGLL